MATEGSEIILLAEDEVGVRSLLRTVLNKAGYTVLEASNGCIAMEVWEERKHEIDLLLTDIVMPEGISGFELASRLGINSPDLPVVFMSGYSADVAGKELVLEEGQNFIQKPAAITNVLEIVRHSLDEYAAPEEVVLAS
ncbi:UNVERIFIED_CONTAM: hypothetical protein GTU68_050833 [Idotea baltica]|nr:hypothetical protein [Idotea baltica]